MGCTMVGSRGKTRSGKISLSVPLAKTSSHINLEQEYIKGKRSNVRLHNTVIESKDFWGTMPYYVLNNRVRLFSAEVNNEKKFESIIESILEILTEFFESFDCNNKKSIEIDSEKYKWIRKYEQGINLVKALGLNEENRFLYLMEGVTKTHLSNKIKEIKYSYKKLKGSKALYSSTI